MAAKLTGGYQTPTGRDPDYPLVGESLGLWTLRGGIGRGGMGEVYEAEYDFLHLLTLRYDPEERQSIRAELAQLPREEQARMASELLGTSLPADARFAIKVCSARRGTAGHRRFLQEAELAEKLGVHPYIVAVHAVHKGLDADAEEPVLGRQYRRLLDSGRHRDLAYMVMTLASRTYDHTKLDLAEAVHIVRCIATALDHAHKAHVIHRDLKPENILGTIEHPLLTDFGIAKEIDQSLGLTRTGQVIGTLDYMSPEQATDAKAVDHRSDIYSLGVVLYEFATGGHLPYIHLAEREACLAAIRSETGQPKWPRDHIPDFPRRLERIILKATAHRAEDRYQEMSELISDLDRFARGEWISPLGRIRPVTWLRYQRNRHTRLVYGIPLLILLLALTWFGLWASVFFDGQRSAYLNDLARLETAEQMIGRSDENQRRVQMLSRAQSDDLKHLIRKFTEDQKLIERYPEISERVVSLARRVATRRYLKADFVGPLADVEYSRDQMQLAADLLAPSWSLSESGLLITDNLLELRLKPYGDGLVYVDLQFRNDVDWRNFRLEIREVVADGGRPDHVVRVLSRGETLQLERSEGDRFIPLDWQGDGAAARQTIALEIGQHGVVSWWPNKRQVLSTAPALTAGRPAEVVLVLPKHTNLYRLHIWPMPPR
jgi:serine/threonine protein kinase